MDGQGGSSAETPRTPAARGPASLRSKPIQTTAPAATVTPEHQPGSMAVRDSNDQSRLPAEPQTMSIRSEAHDAVAQASPPANLTPRGGDDERSIPVEDASLISLDSAFTGIQPASHRASPRIAADPCGSPLISARGIYLCFRLRYRHGFAKVHRAGFRPRMSRYIPEFHHNAPLCPFWIPLNPA